MRPRQPDPLERLGRAASRAASSPIPCRRSGTVTARATACRGLSEDIGSWNTAWTARRYVSGVRRPRAVTSSPSKSIVPLVTSTSRSSARPMVLLPDPDSPTRPSVSPGRRSKLTASTAFTCSLRNCIARPAS
ncbi:hypothetical protein BJF79_08990 [Actinomadura sp. CNU-125]|nr:hypothetical protein BJF79_08990 [Actinomadura sp. CNU-125]